MGLLEKNRIASYNMRDHAVGLVDFVNGQLRHNMADFGGCPVIHVMDDEGNHAIGATIEEVVMSDGSKVYNLVLKLDR